MDSSRSYTHVTCISIWWHSCLMSTHIRGHWCSARTYRMVSSLLYTGWEIQDQSSDAMALSLDCEIHIILYVWGSTAPVQVSEYSKSSTRMFGCAVTSRGGQRACGKRSWCKPAVLQRTWTGLLLTTIMDPSDGVEISIGEEAHWLKCTLFCRTASFKHIFLVYESHNWLSLLCIRESWNCIFKTSKEPDGTCRVLAIFVGWYVSVRLVLKEFAVNKLMISSTRLLKVC